MSSISISVSTRPDPDALRFVNSLADGIELKLDWNHIDTTFADTTVAEWCEERSVDPAAIRSVHLPPGTRQRHGMAVAPGNVGTIVDFVHRRLGDGVDPALLTVHSARRFAYREQVQRLGTVADLAGIPLGVENAPDGSHLYAPADLVAFAMALRVLDVEDVSLVLDTAHLPARRGDDATGGMEAKLDRMDRALRRRVEAYLTEAMSDFEPPEERREIADPWGPSLLTARSISADRLGAVHLNDPGRDGLPTTPSTVGDGIEGLLEFCADGAIPIILEPAWTDRRAVAACVERLCELAR